MNDRDLLERLAEDVPTARLREGLERTVRHERRRRWTRRAAALLAAALALGFLVRLALPDRAATPPGVLSADNVFSRLDAVVELLGRERLAPADIDLLIETARNDPSVNVRLLSIDALHGAGVARARLERLAEDDAPPIVLARLDAALASLSSENGP